MVVGEIEYFSLLVQAWNDSKSTVALKPAQISAREFTVALSTTRISILFIYWSKSSFILSFTEYILKHLHARSTKTPKYIFLSISHVGSIEVSTAFFTSHQNWWRHNVGKNAGKNLICLRWLCMAQMKARSIFFTHLFLFFTFYGPQNYDTIYFDNNYNFYMCAGMLQLIVHVFCTMLWNWIVFLRFRYIFSDLFWFCPFYWPKNGDTIYFDNNYNVYMCAGMLRLISHVFATILWTRIVFFSCFHSILLPICSYFPLLWAKNGDTIYYHNNNHLSMCAGMLQLISNVFCHYIIKLWSFILIFFNFHIIGIFGPKVCPKT